MFDVMFYSYCKAYNVSPLEARNTPIFLIKKMLEIQSVASEIEAEEYEKLKRKK
tara:strand:- start:167 stop:328 length:162 start_codon:yes stop_codon:yes gene_type:complete